jgi:SAM-dependent methyltransferase
MYAYDSEFYETADRTAAASADGLIRYLTEVLPIRSVLDIGCGRGVWLAQWLRNGATTAVGVDGPYIDSARLAIPRESFVAHDLATSLSLGRRFDLVQSLEVAEHVKESCAETFLDNLVRHGPLILFSAATPGQGGEHHINEQPWEYWRRKFAARQYEVFDYLRPRVRHEQSIYFCYRVNTFVFAHESAIGTLPAAIRASHVPAGVPLHDELSYWLKLRFAAVRLLPQSAIDRIARAKYLASSLLGGRQ